MIAVAALLIAVVAGASEPALFQSFEDLQAGHISENVPADIDFAAYLTRDVRAYLSGQGLAHAQIALEMLRDGPTQSGAAYPKFYVWVDAVAADGVVKSGVVRLAAVARTHFEVTDFVTREQIIADPDSLSLVIPAALVDRTIARANQPPVSTAPATSP